MSAENLPTRYDPESFESGWYEKWEAAGAFKPEINPDGEPFCIVIPPPNVTGVLHIGHALQFTLQDLIIRWRRMQGFKALWLPGTDHAGIATQVMVERQLAKEGTTRQEVGREKFLERMWQWKQEHKDNISHQAKALGASCDWSRERFTLDEGLSKAVRRAFVTLYNEGLIYRDQRLINWCPRCHTALSDLEVVHQEQHGKLWNFAYPLEAGGEIVVSTTRPETMLGDTAIAVHPDDERYRELVGSFVIHPFLDRRIPIIADAELVDPEFGTGAVKVTPAHDPNDFAVGKRHDLEFINILDSEGRINANGGPFAGQDRFEARTAVLNALGQKGLLRGERPHEMSIGHCQRCDTIVEPFLSKQWFVNAKPLAEKALDVVHNGDVEIVPEFWKATYDHWLENIQDWCISRQLWWGHRIPAFTCPEGHLHVSEEIVTTCPDCGAPVEQDPDVLDTWFSSGLWPFSTLGWPDQTEDLATFYPTSVLITGFDILFFWVARMIMMGCHLAGDVPFRTVHLTGLVRDAKGDKMSKTKGNTIDPLEVVDTYGADAVRFTLAALASPGRDLPLDMSRMEGYRGFATKVWNAARFVQMKLQGDELPLEQVSQLELEAPQRWILSRLSHTIASVNRAWESFRFDEGCHQLYHFIWHTYCDWYLELVKTTSDRLEVRSVLRGALLEALKLLHPVMPFITEEIASHLGHEGMLITAPYPVEHPAWEDDALEADFAALQELVGGLRSYRALVGLNQRQEVSLTLVDAGAPRAAFFQAHAAQLKQLAAVGRLSAGPAGKHAVEDVLGGMEVAIELPAGAIGPGQREKLEKQLDQLATTRASIEKRLSNPGFTANAPSEVVQGARDQLAEVTARLERLRRTVEALSR
ncbi:MAG: valine--tRNA ligase [Acidobacteria bacterium]|nr:valine--tRNA ligase [Acidobacteriota bacterium]